jgi:uncharacterized Zn-finger protein
VDLDVEEPDLHLFLQPLITETEMALMPVHEVEEAKCTYCGTCPDFKLVWEAFASLKNPWGLWSIGPGKAMMPFFASAGKGGCQYCLKFFTIAPLPR